MGESFIVQVILVVDSTPEMPHQQLNVSDGVHFITCLINKKKLEGVKLEENDIIKMGNFSIKTVTMRGKEQ